MNETNSMSADHFAGAGKVMQQALELERLADRFSEGWHEGIKIDASDIMLLTDAAAALRERLAQPVQEPFALLVRKHSWNEGQYECAPPNAPEYGRQWADERVLVYASPPQRKPLTPREIELLDGMIEVQLNHAERCDSISNRAIAEKQKGWDMERVALLRKLKHKVEAEGFAPPNIWPEIVRLCELVAEQEREACAKVCDDAAELLNRLTNYAGADEANACAAAIRARGNT